MEYVKLGDYQLSRIAYGCYAMGGYDWGCVSDSDSIRAVHRAVDNGITFFDTADVYGLGHSEEVLGKALSTCNKHVFVASKFGLDWAQNGTISRNSSAKYITKAVEASLRRLKMDCIPLYQIHYPDVSTSFEETMSALIDCQQSGKIKYIGCSNFDKKQFESLQCYGDVISLQSLFSLVDRDSTPKSAQSEVGKIPLFFAYGCLVKGLLCGKFNLKTKFGENDNRRRDPHFQGDQFSLNLEVADAVSVVARKYKKTPSQVALRWVLDTPGVSSAIVGVRNKWTANG